MQEERGPQRRRPAHHAPVERFNEPVIVHVTVCTKDRQPRLACTAGHALIREAWQAADHWRVGTYVIMPDHLHLFCAPGRTPMPSLRDWVRFWKTRIASHWPHDGAHWIAGGTGAVRSESDAFFKLWQRDFWDTQMRSRAHYEEKLAYVRMNPVRKGLAASPEQWPYQGEIYPIAWV